MDVLKAIQHRQSIRAFLETPVTQAQMQAILDIARWAPSGVNCQPWQAIILGPKAREKMAKAIIEAREQKLPENPDYRYYPKKWVEPYKSRRKACGAALYGALNIQMGDIELRKEAWYRNYHFFQAPAAYIFAIDKALSKGAWLDMGMFLQSVMLAARGMGLETCPLASLAEFPDIVRHHLHLNADQEIVCGMAVGYADWDHPINGYRTTRESTDSFSKYVE